MTRKKRRASQKEENKVLREQVNLLDEQLTKTKYAFDLLKQDTMIWIQVLNFDFMVDHAYQVKKGNVKK